MKVEFRCINCEGKCILEKKDIIPLTKKEKENIKAGNKIIEEEMNKKKKTFFGKEVYENNAYFRGVLKGQRITAYGKFKCMACGNKQLIIKV